MNEQEIESLLNNYPYSASIKHCNKSLNKDWYPIAFTRYGYLLCSSCYEYGGNKLSQYFPFSSKTIQI